MTNQIISNNSKINHLISTEDLNYESIISNDSKEIKKSTHIILPGVGAFGAAMKKINEKISIEILEDEVINKKKPFLGICVGMQLLADKSEEFGEHKGLGWIKGKVVKLKSKILPHVGWNNLILTKKNSLFENHTF